MTLLTAAFAPVRAVAVSWAGARELAGWSLTELVGEGRWMRVFRARPRNAPADGPADYAIKMPREEQLASPVCREMLAREAWLGRQISHPHLAAVLDSHVGGSPPFLVLPYLEGATLAAMLAARPVAVAAGLWVARQTAEALAALHGAGWRHGDVKPANLRLAPSGHATLLDLGLAQPLAGAAAGPAAPFAGSVAYAAPEMFCAAHRPSGASDVYSLGVVLFEALAGRLPFDDTDPDRVAAAHLRQPPPELRRLAPHVPGRVARVVSRMLAKEPLRRPTSSECVELLAALEIETFGEGLSVRAAGA